MLRSNRGSSFFFCVFLWLLFWCCLCSLPIPSVDSLIWESVITRGRPIVLYLQARFFSISASIVTAGSTETETLWLITVFRSLWKPSDNGCPGMKAVCFLVDKLHAKAQYSVYSNPHIKFSVYFNSWHWVWLWNLRALDTIHVILSFGVSTLKSSHACTQILYIVTTHESMGFICHTLTNRIVDNIPSELFNVMPSPLRIRWKMGICCHVGVQEASSFFGKMEKGLNWNDFISARG